MKKLALIVPHKESSQGAQDHTGETEYSKMGRVLRKVKLELINAKIFNGADYSIPLEVGVFKRITTIEEVCRRVIAFKPDLSLENHFNGGGGNGIEILCLRYDEDIELAKRLSFMVSNWFKSVRRRDNGAYILKGYERGSDNIEIIKEALPHCTPLLVEPFFGDTKEDSIKFAKGLGEDKYVDTLVLFILDTFNAKIVKPITLPIFDSQPVQPRDLTDKERLDQLEDKMDQVLSTLGV